MSRRRRNPLEITKTHLRQIGDGKAAMIVGMYPADFLRATTDGPEHMQEIIAEAQPLANYNRYATEGENIIPPLLRIRIEDPDYAYVESHEGRHRAAAVLTEEPGTLMPVAILLRSDSAAWKESVAPGQPWDAIYYAKLADLPGRVRGEHKGSQGIWRSRMRVLYERDPKGGKGPGGFRHVNLPLDVEAALLDAVRENPIPIELTPFTGSELRPTVAHTGKSFPEFIVFLWASTEGLLRVGGNTLFSDARAWQDEWQFSWVASATRFGVHPGRDWTLVGYLDAAATWAGDDGILEEMFVDARAEGYYHTDTGLEDEWDREERQDEMRADLGIGNRRIPFFVALSGTLPQLHGMKIGAYLYSRAMDEAVKEQGALISHGYGNRSEKASRVWHSGEHREGTLFTHGYRTRSVAPAADDPTYQMRHYTHTGEPRTKPVMGRRRRKVVKRPARKRKVKRNPSGPTSADLMRLEAEGFSTHWPSDLHSVVNASGLADFVRGHRERIEIAVGAPLDWDHPYGCGAYGCAFPIPSRPELVLKVTTDPQEGPITQAIMETGYDKTMRGLARIENVWRVPHLAYDDLVTPPELYVNEIYLVLRENIDPIADRYQQARGHDWDHISPVPEAHHALIVFSTEVRNLYDAQLNALQAPSPLYQQRLERTEVAVERALNMLKYDVSTRDIGRALNKLGAKGIYLADLHLGNLGFHLYEWVGGIAQALGLRQGLQHPWCVFDYGASPSLEAPSVPLMPGASDINQGEVEFLMSRQRMVRQNPALEDVRQRIKRL